MAFAQVCAYLSFGLFCAMALAWWLARGPGKSGMMDVVWSYATGAAGAAGALMPAAGASPARQAWVAALALAWGLRLGTHIWWRGRGGHDDPRYVKMRQKWGASADWRMFLMAEFQAVIALILAAVIATAGRSPAPFGQWSDLAGIGILAIAVAGEAIADAQLAAFRTNPANRGKVCEAGLWSLSRHPNYFFEWLAWCAWPVVAIGPMGTDPLAWGTLVGPALIYYLLVHVSGIPMLEAHMRRSRGAAFLDSQRRIRAFWPIPRWNVPPAPEKGPV